jgi:hypothetical protein
MFIIHWQNRSQIYIADLPSDTGLGPASWDIWWLPHASDSLWNKKCFDEAVLNEVETTVRLQELRYLLTTTIRNSTGEPSSLPIAVSSLHIPSSLGSPPLFTRTTRIRPHTHQPEYGQRDSFPSRSPTNGPTQLLMKIFIMRSIHCQRTIRRCTVWRPVHARVLEPPS